MAHCYRMLGAVADAEDAVQEALVKAWRNREAFEGRAALKTWLTRIATRVCLDHLEGRSRHLLEGRRLATAGLARADFGAPTPTEALGTVELVASSPLEWVTPIPDALIGLAPAFGSQPGPDPANQAALRQSVRLAFIAALQCLAPRQRAALLMAEVLDMSAAEIADALETTVPAVNSALQRARDTLGRRRPDPEHVSLGLADVHGPDRAASSAALAERFVAAFERYDVEGLTALLREDAVMSMPPFELWLEGPASIGAWLLGRGCGCRGSRLVRTAANGQLAFGQYRPGASPDDPHVPWALIVLELEAEPQVGAAGFTARIAGMTYFLDTASLFPRFGLPMALG